MLTEGWDANTVTHVLGIRAFGTQLLCEQVIGRALRRQSYDLNEDRAVQRRIRRRVRRPVRLHRQARRRTAAAPARTVQVQGRSPRARRSRNPFPARRGLSCGAPRERITATFNADSMIELTPDLVCPPNSRTPDIIGQTADMTLEHLHRVRTSTLLFHLTKRLCTPSSVTRATIPTCTCTGSKRITKQWLDGSSLFKGSTYPRCSCTRIWRTWRATGSRPASRRHFKAAAHQGAARSVQPQRLHGARAVQHLKTDRWDTSGPPTKNHVNWVILDSDWEAEFCRVAESHPRVTAYTRTQPGASRSRIGSAPRRARISPTSSCWWTTDTGPTTCSISSSRSRATAAKTRRRRSRRWKRTGCPASTTWDVRALGIRGADRRVSHRSRLRSQGREGVQSHDRRSAPSSRRGWVDVAKATSSKAKTGKTVETLTHDEDTRKNIPTAEYQSVVEKDEQTPVRSLSAQPRSRSAARLARQGRAGLERPRRPGAAALHPGEGAPEGAHRRPAAAVEGAKPQRADAQIDLFADFNGVPEGADKTDFYQHDQNWSNRMILGDSLQVMASLAEREGLRGKVQCIYIDPPYGIKFNSNFQWSTTSRDVKDGNADHITREPEQVKAFRDTWRDGIHSYLTYLRDRLTVARDLLSDSGSIFVQIGDENVHRVRALMDEVFGDDNFCYRDSVSRRAVRMADLCDPRQRLHPLVSPKTKPSDQVPALFKSSTSRCRRLQTRIAVERRWCRNLDQRSDIEAEAGFGASIQRVVWHLQSRRSASADSVGTLLPGATVFSLRGQR